MKWQHSHMVRCAAARSSSSWPSGCTHSPSHLFFPHRPPLSGFGKENVGSNILLLVCAAWLFGEGFFILHDGALIHLISVFCRCVRIVSDTKSQNPASVWGMCIHFYFDLESRHHTQRYLRLWCLWKLHKVETTAPAALCVTHQWSRLYLF